MQGCVRSRRALAALVALTALAVAGCGSSSGSSSSSTTSTPVTAQTRTFLTSMCTAIGPVISDFGSFRTSLAQAKSPDLQKYKMNVERVLGAMTEHAVQAVAGLQQAGAPEIDSGGAVAKGVITEFTAFHAALIQAESSAKAIPTGNIHQFQLAFGGMLATLGSALRGAGVAVNALDARLKAPSLAGAEKSVPACRLFAG